MSLTCFDIVRRDDGEVVCSFEMPAEARALLYQKDEGIIFSLIFPDEIIGTPTLFTQMLMKAGYRISGPQ